ncbi:hypothetical protein Tco_1286138 [Tanacetum coccineum]
MEDLGWRRRDETMAMIRMSHLMMTRMMMLILRRMRGKRSTPPADSIVVALPAVDQAPSVEETEPFETDESAATSPPHPAYRVTARIRGRQTRGFLPPQKRLGIALSPRYEVGESSSAPTARPPGGIRVDYGFVATIDREIMRDLKRDSLPLGLGGSTSGSDYRVTGSGPQEIGGDYRVAGSGPQETGTVH